MREFNGTRIRGNNPSHYNHTPNAILPDDLVTHLLKYYGHIVISDKYAVYDNKVLEYDNIRQLSLPGNNFDLSLAEMGLKHTSFYGKIMDYLKENIYISPDDLEECTSREEVSEKLHEISKSIKQKLEALIKMRDDNKDLTVFNALENANEQLLKEFGSLLFRYEKLLNNAQNLSNLGINNQHGCGCHPVHPPVRPSAPNSIMEEISNLKNSKMDTVEANNKFALKEAIPTINHLAEKGEVSDALSKSAENVKKDVLRTVGEIYQEKVSSGNGIKIYNEHEIAADTKVLATREFVNDSIDAAKIAASGKEIDLTSYAKKVDVEKKADQVEVDKKISKEEADRTYATRSDLQYKANAIDLEYKLDKDEAKKTYATKKELPDLSDVVVYEDLDKVKYVLERAINKKADADVLSNYATAGDLASKMDKGVAEDIFARKNDLISKANKTDLNSYATKEEVISRINEAKLSGAGQEVDLSIYALKNEVTRNITAAEEKIKTEVYTSIGGKLDKVTAENTYAKKDQIPSIAHLASKDELTKAINDASQNYVNKIAYDLEKANFADKEEVKVKLDKSEAIDKYLTKEAAGQAYVTQAIYVSEKANLLVTKAQLEEKINAIKIPSIDGLATEESLNNVKALLDEKLSKIEAENLYVKKDSLVGYATEDYVKDQINQAQLGGEGQEVDLSAYALKKDTEKAITDAKDELNLAIDNKIDKSVVESDYAKKTEIPQPVDTSNFATNESVDEKIAQAQLGGGTDASTLVTKEVYEKDKATFALISDTVAKTDYNTDKATFATKDELNAKADATAIPSIDGLAKADEVVSKTDYDTDKATFALITNTVAKDAYDADKATFALAADVVSNETYTADKDTFALKTALEELTTKYNDLLARVEKLEQPSA